jgi:glycosyltransferase involved in cell wall biosynthesis
MSLRIVFALHGPRDLRTAVYLTTHRRAEFLRERGHTVDILTPADIVFGGWPRLQPLLLPIGLAGHRLAGYDVVVFHSHLAWAHGLVRGLPGGARRPATIVAFHGLEPLYHEAVARELARTGESLSAGFHVLHRLVVPRLLALASRRADRVFCLNTQERAYLVNHHWADPSKVKVMPNGVETDLFLERAGHRPRGTRILFTGQWLRAKGIRYLAGAFELLAAAHDDVELTCVGTGAGLATVERDFSGAVRGRVRVVPHVNRTELRAELARADVFMFPSLSEGFSGALLEAMAAALPVIATPAGAAPDLFQDDVNAVLVPFADAPALAGAAARLIDDPALRHRLGTAAQSTARHYTWDTVNAVFAADVERIGGGQR